MILWLNLRTILIPKIKTCINDSRTSGYNNDIDKRFKQGSDEKSLTEEAHFIQIITLISLHVLIYYNNTKIYMSLLYLLI